MCVLAFLTISVFLMLAHYLSERHLYSKLGSLLVLFNFRVPFLVGHNAFLTSIVPLMLAHYLSEGPEWWSPPLCFPICERALPILKPTNARQLGTSNIFHMLTLYHYTSLYVLLQANGQNGSKITQRRRRKENLQMNYFQELQIHTKVKP